MMMKMTAAHTARIHPRLGGTIITQIQMMTTTGRIETGMNTLTTTMIRILAARL
jgi:hypothetical protein